MGEARRPPPPDIVLVLTDDLSLDLVRTMAEVQRMSRTGASYRHAYVTDARCCPSRASLLTGQYPHQTGVRINNSRSAAIPGHLGPVGGWKAFRKFGSTARSVNVRLQRAGYTTGYVGKYLNRYEPELIGRRIPPGWTQWEAVFGTAYDGWDFAMAVDRGRAFGVRRVEAPPKWASNRVKDRAYVGAVIARRALAFIRAHADRRKPYFLVVSTFATHPRLPDDPAYPGLPRFPPAFRDRAGPGTPGNCGAVRCDDLTVDGIAGFRDDVADNVPLRADGRPARQWRTPGRVPSDRRATRVLRTRAQMAQSVDRMLRRIRNAVGPDTYVILTSDHGHHVGQHGLGLGKNAPFRSDVQVPLVVEGPGVVPGGREEVVSLIDLAPTFEALAGLRRARYRSGLSLVPTFTDPTLSRRQFAFSEHVADPGAAGGSRSRTRHVPSHLAVRDRTGLLARFDLDPRWRVRRFGWEYYHYGQVAWEQTNAFGDPSHQDHIAVLKQRLRMFDRCRSVRRDERVPAACRRLTR
ncbi:sulfatase-like hydrolase/transferase [Nocardioides coralli]|nr:sulfatase-like hydrolase/transferase [Nocardioides coralli]